MFEDACRDDRAHARQRAGDVLGGLAPVDTDFLFTDLDRVPAQRRDRDLDRDTRPRRRLLEQCGHALPGEHGRYRRRRRLPREGLVEEPRQAGRIQVVDFEETTGHDSPLVAFSTSASTATASSISASDTSNGGARRSALAGHRVHDQAGFHAALRDILGVDPGRELGREQETEAAHRNDTGHLLQRLGEPDARSIGAGRDLFAFHHVEHRERGARGERLAAERRGVIARLERGRDLGARPARADRHAVAERLGQRDDVGPDPAVLEAEPPTRATETGLDLVDDEQGLALVAQPAHGLQVLGCRGVHAAFALHRFEHHRGDAIVERVRERVDVLELHLPEAARKRLERLLLLRLARGGERRERAAVERAVRGDHVVPLGTAVALPVAAGELDRALVGLRTRVGEEHASAATEQRVEARTEPRLQVVVIEVRDVQQRLRLVRDRGGDLRVGMSERRDREPGEEVEVRGGRRNRKSNVPSPRTNDTGNRPYVCMTCSASSAWTSASESIA